MSYSSTSQEKLIKIKFPDGKLDWVQYQNDLRNLKLKISQLIRIPFDCVVLLNTAKQEIANAQEFSNFEIGNEYEIMDLRQLLGSHKQKSESQQRELQSLKQQSQAEIQFLNNKVQQLEQYIESINNQQNLTGIEWQNKYNSLFQENQKQNDANQSLSKYIGELNFSLDEKTKQFQDAQSQITIQSFEIDELQQQNERLIMRLQEEKEQLSSKEEENKQIKYQLSQKEEELINFNQQLQQFNYQYQISQQDIYNNNQKIIELEQTIDENQQKFQDDLKKAKNEKKKAQDDNQLKEEEINNLKLKLEKVNNELQDKAKQILKLKNDISEQEISLVQVNDEKDNLQSSYNYQKNKLQKALNEIKQLQSTIEKQEQSQNPQSYVIDNELIEKQKYKIQQQEDKINDFELQIQTYEQKITKLEQKLIQITQENKLKDLRINQLQQNIEDLTSKLKDAENQVKVEKQNLIEQEEKQKQYIQEKLKQKEAEISALEGVNQNIQIQLNKKDKDILELQNNVNEINQKLSDAQSKNRKEIQIRDEKITKLTQQLNGTHHFRQRIDRLVDNMYDTKVYIGSNKENLSIEKYLMENQPIANLFTKDTVQLKFQVFKVLLEVNQLKQKIYQDSNLEFTNCYNFIPQGEIAGLRTKTRIMESNVDRIYFYSCTSGMLQNQVLVIRELIKIPQNKDQEFQYMITQGGGSAVAQFLLEEFYQLLNDSKDKIAHYNSLSAQKIVIPDNLQFQDQLILKLHDDASNIDRYYNASIINVQLKNNRYDFIRYNGGHKFTNNSDFAVFLQVFSYFTIWKTNRQLAVTYIQGIENQFFDPIVSTFDGFFNVLDQGNLEIKTFESLFRSTKNNYKGEQLLKCLGII